MNVHPPTPMCLMSGSISLLTLAFLYLCKFLPGWRLEKTECRNCTVGWPSCKGREALEQLLCSRTTAIPCCQPLPPSPLPSPRHTSFSVPSSLPHRTIHIALLQTSVRIFPLPRPHGWCTSLAGTRQCGAPFSAGLPGSWSLLVPPCRSSHLVPVPTSPSPLWCRGQSAQERGARCCSNSWGSSPVCPLWCKHHHQLS